MEVFGIGGNHNYYYSDDHKYFSKVYLREFVVQSVISKIALKASNGVFKSKNEKSPLLKLISQPNQTQTTQEFINEYVVYLKCFGYAVIWKKYKSVGVIDSLELININPEDISQIASTTIKFNYNGKTETVKKTDIIVFYDTIRDKEGKGVSRLKPLKKQIENVRNAEKAIGIQIENSGTTLVSPKGSASSQGIDEGLNAPVPQTNGTLKTQKQEMEENLGSRGLENRIIVSSKGLDAVNLSSQLNSVKFHEMVENDVLSILYAFNYPQDLSPYGKNAKYDNKELSEADLIQNEVVPMINSFCKGINEEFINLDPITVDYSHLNAMAKVRLITTESNKLIIEQYKTLLDLGVINVKEFKEILIKHGILWQ